MMELVIRKAVIDDLETLLTFEQGVIAFERSFDETLDNDPISYYDIGKMIQSSVVEVMVAEINNELVGSGYARIEEPKPYLKHSKFAYLGFMYVKPEFRGEGINKILINKLLQWISSMGIEEVRLDVYSENSGAIKAYKKAGFVPHLLNMRMSI